MNEKDVSQVQQTANTFKHLADEQIGRVEAIYGDLARMETKTLAQMQTATAEAVKLWTGSLEYGAQLSSEFRKLAFQAARHTFELATSKF